MTIQLEKFSTVNCLINLRSNIQIISNKESHLREWLSLFMVD